MGDIGYFILIRSVNVVNCWIHIWFPLSYNASLILSILFETLVFLNSFCVSLNTTGKNDSHMRWNVDRPVTVKGQVHYHVPFVSVFLYIYKARNLFVCQFFIWQIVKQATRLCRLSGWRPSIVIRVVQSCARFTHVRQSVQMSLKGNCLWQFLRMCMYGSESG